MKRAPVYPIYTLEYLKQTGASFNFKFRFNKKIHIVRI